MGARAQRAALAKLAPLVDIKWTPKRPSFLPSDILNLIKQRQETEAGAGLGGVIGRVTSWAAGAPAVVAPPIAPLPSTFTIQPDRDCESVGRPLPSPYAPETGGAIPRYIPASEYYTIAPGHPLSEMPMRPSDFRRSSGASRPRPRPRLIRAPSYWHFVSWCYLVLQAMALLARLPVHLSSRSHCIPAHGRRRSSLQWFWFLQCASVGWECRLVSGQGRRMAA